MRKLIKLEGIQILVLGFLAIILIGTILLSLPIATSMGVRTGFLESLFTSTSAVCITGLTTLNTAMYWSVFGQIVIMVLMEIGALGFMCFAIIIYLIIGKKITLRDRLLVKESINTFSIQGLVKMVKDILKFSLLVQLLGTLLLSTQFVMEFGMKKGIFISLFHSVSSFSNAGIDLFGNSLINYNSNVLVLSITAILSIIGGLGFVVLLELYEFKEVKKLSLHSKLVLYTSGILILIGAFLILIFEFNNPLTISNMSLGDKILNSTFSSITPRTLGFYSVDINDMTISSKFLNIILMIIGGSPGSTAGGIKTVTLAIIFLTAISVIKGREDTEAFERRISKELVYKSFTIAFIALNILIVSTMILTYTEKGIPFLSLLNETTAALSTSGMTLNLTGELSEVGKVLIIILMYIGRIGPLTILLAVKKKGKKLGFKYPKGKILIG